MSRQQDLADAIREFYSIIREYEDVIRTSDRPEEKQRARRQIDGQWALIEGYVGEYRRLASGEWPSDITEIAAHFSAPEEPSKIEQAIEERQVMRGGELPGAERDKLRLRDVLANAFSMEELRLLCFDLGIDFEDLRGEAKMGKVISLVDFMNRRARLDELSAYVRRARPGAM